MNEVRYLHVHNNIVASTFVLVYEFKNISRSYWYNIQERILL